MKQAITLQKNIMRRVYYAFAIRIATHPITVHLALLVVAVYALARLVHVAAVFQNFSTVRVGDIGTYILSTLISADFATLAVIGIVCMTLLSLRIQLSVPQFRRTKMV